MKENLKKKINEIYLIYEKKILNILNGLIEKNEILNNFVLLNKKKIFLKDVSDCIEKGKKYVFFIKDKKLIPAFYKKISLFFYEVKREKNNLLVSINQKKINNMEKKKMITEVLENFKKRCNVLIKDYKKEMPLRISKENERVIKEIRNFLKEKILFLKRIAA